MAKVEENDRRWASVFLGCRTYDDAKRKLHAEDLKTVDALAEHLAEYRDNLSARPALVCHDSLTLEALKDIASLANACLAKLSGG